MLTAISYYSIAKPSVKTFARIAERAKELTNFRLLLYSTMPDDSQQPNSGSTCLSALLSPSDLIIIAEKPRPRLEARKATWPRQSFPLRQCNNCPLSFRPYRSWQRFCSVSCRNESYERVWRDRNSTVKKALATLEKRSLKKSREGEVT